MKIFKIIGSLVLGLLTYAALMGVIYLLGNHLIATLIGAANIAFIIYITCLWYFGWQQFKTFIRGLF